MATDWSQKTEGQFHALADVLFQNMSEEEAISRGRKALARFVEPKDKEELPLLTRISKTVVSLPESQIDLCWHILPDIIGVLQKAVEREGGVSNSAEPVLGENSPAESSLVDQWLSDLNKTVVAAQKMLRTAYEKKGFSLGQIILMNAWQSDALASDFCTFEPDFYWLEDNAKAEGDATLQMHSTIVIGEKDEENADREAWDRADGQGRDLVVPFNKINSVPLIVSPGQSVRVEMLRAFMSITSGDLDLGKCEECLCIYPVSRARQRFCSNRCGTRNRVRKFNQKNPKSNAKSKKEAVKVEV